MPDKILLNVSNVSADGSSMRAVIPQMDFSNKQVCLASMDCYNCFYNITSAIGNNKIEFLGTDFINRMASTNPLVGRFYCTIPDGFYDIYTLNEYMHSFFIENNLYLYDTFTGQNKYFFEFVANVPQYKFQIMTYYVPNLGTRYLLPPTASGVVPNIANFVPFDTPITSFTSLGFRIPQGTAGQTNSFKYYLGFNKGNVYGNGPELYSAGKSALAYVESPAEIFLSEYFPNIIPVTDIIITTNISHANIQIPQTILCQVPMTAEFGALNQFKNYCEDDYSPCFTSKFKEIVLKFYDQNLNPIKFMDKNISVILAIKDIE